MSNVRAFGSTEYWFSAIKVFAVLASSSWPGGWCWAAAIPTTGWRTTPRRPRSSLAALGVWGAVIVAIFSYMGVEVIAIAAAEARQPRVAVRRAFKVTFLRLLLFYIATLGLILCIAPRDELLNGGSPFVTVMQVVGIPYADSVLNFVLIVAALSAMNAQLYAASRTLKSLSEVGYAPALSGRVAANGARCMRCGCPPGGSRSPRWSTPGARGRDGHHDFPGDLRCHGDLADDPAQHVAFRRRHRQQGTTPDFRLPGFPAGSLLGACCWPDCW